MIAAWNDDKTVVLLFVHDGGIDDKLVKAATARLAALPEAATFIVPASQISRYAAITEGVGVNRVPALVVVRPKRLHQTIPTASVSYGFQSGAERRPGGDRRRLQGPHARLPPAERWTRGTTRATCGRSPNPATRPRRPSTRTAGGTPGLTPP